MTPATFETGVVGDFTLQLFASSEDLADNLSLKYIDYSAIIKSIESGPPPAKDGGKEKEPEIARPSVDKKEEHRQAVLVQQQSEGIEMANKHI